MNGFVYLIAEGVTDVALISQVLRRYLAMQQVTTLDSLPREAKEWLDRFKWPSGGKIDRFAVPAPVFMEGGGALVALRNAQGLTRMNETLNRDDAAFELMGWKPDALGVLLDADNNAPDERFRYYRDKLTPEECFPRLSNLKSIEGVIAQEGGRRSGIFVFPSANETGTLDDLLLSLGKDAYPKLHGASTSFVTSWHPSNSAGELFKELRKPAGATKAQLSAMAALLKPGKNLNASLQDHPWVPEGKPPEVLNPLVRFLTEILGT